MECKATSEQDLMSIDKLLDSEHVDVWTEHLILNSKLAIRVDELGKKEVEALQLECQITRLTGVPAIQRMLLETTKRQKLHVNINGDAFFDDYHRYDVIVNRLQKHCKWRDNQIGGHWKVH